MFGGLLKGSIFVIIFAIATHFIRPEFDVHSSGVVVITGASSGIGKSAAIKVASLGYTVVAGVRKESDGKDLVNSMEDKETAKRIIPTIIDVTNTDSIDKAVVTSQKLGKVIGVICNAGIDEGTSAPVEYLDPATEQRTFAVNYFGLKDTVIRFLPLLRANHGRLINIGSIAGTISGPFGQPYAVSKHMVRSLSDSLRHELKSLGVSVSRIEPGFVKTLIHSKKETFVSKKDTVFSQLSSDLKEPYEPELKRLESTIGPMAEKASSTVETDNAIVHALTASRPQPCYHPGSVGGAPAKVSGFLFKFLEAIDPSWVDALMDTLGKLGESGLL